MTNIPLGPPAMHAAALPLPGLPPHAADRSPGTRSPAAFPARSGRVDSTYLGVEIGICAARVVTCVGSALVAVALVLHLLSVFGVVRLAPVPADAFTGDKGARLNSSAATLLVPLRTAAASSEAGVLPIAMLPDEATEVWGQQLDAYSSQGWQPVVALDGLGPYARWAQHNSSAWLLLSLGCAALIAGDVALLRLRTRARRNWLSA